MQGTARATTPTLGDTTGDAALAALKQAAIVWDAPSLDRLPAAPMQVVPATPMAYRGNPERQARADLDAGPPPGRRVAGR